jgi:uncharacterized phage protein (TIGR02220 family)
MDDADVGKYIKIICMLHQRGGLSEQELETITKGMPSSAILNLLQFDDKRGYYSAWLDEIMDKRKKHSEKQRENIMKRWGKQQEEDTNEIPNEYQKDTKDIQGGKGLECELEIPLENENEIEKEIVIVNKSEIKKEKYDIDIYKRIIDHLNEKIGSKYKHSTRTTKEHITARLDEGFKEDDFYIVIDKKVFEWFKDAKMRQFLRPETLFGTKFESYLNAPVQKKGLGSVGIDISMMMKNGGQQ